MANPITEDAILRHLSICPMTGEEIAEDLKAKPSVVESILAVMQRRGDVVRRSSARTEGRALYSLPDFRPDDDSLGEGVEPYLCRDYGGQYDNPWPV